MARMTRGPRLPNLRAVLYGVLALVAVFGAVSNGHLVRQTEQIQREQALADATSRQRLVAEQVARHAGQLATESTAADRQQARDQLRLSIAALRAGQRALNVCLVGAEWNKWSPGA
jgi:hypothetical protein